jgi:predicted metal-binding protein
MVKKIGIIRCYRIQETSCIGCAKCNTTVNERLHAFKGCEEEVRIVFNTTCGDCPGLVLPRIELQMLVLEKLGQEVDEVYFGTCVSKAVKMMNCPMNLEGIRDKLGKTLGIPIKVGTHGY